jgi:hypothetical protein
VVGCVACRPPSRAFHALSPGQVRAIRLPCTTAQPRLRECPLSSIEAFMLATTAWLDWLKYIEDLGWEDIPGKDLEPNRRDKPRDEAYRRLLLLAASLAR